jgi:hypothetical protein
LPEPRRRPIPSPPPRHPPPRRHVCAQSAPRKHPFSLIFLFPFLSIILGHPF